MEMNQMQMMQQQMPMDDMAEAGRGTDTVLAHLSLGEVVIPRAFLDDPQVMQALQMIFQDFGADMAEFTVGDPANKINPETGHPEFFKKFFRRIAPFIAPVLSIAAPGVGTALGSAILGAGATGASTLGNALIGGTIGGITGGGKGALLGAAGSAIGANLGNLPGDALPNGVQGPVQPGSGILGQVGSATGLTQSSMPSIGGGLFGSSGGGSSLSNLSSIGSAIGGFRQDKALKKQQEQLLGAQAAQLSNLDNLNPVDVQNDPGYQFNLEQGEQALQRAAAAGGGLFSGAQLKAASQYGQNFANNYYGQAYNRQATKVGAQNDIFANRGNILGNATLARSNNINQTLANAISGSVGAPNLAGISNDQLIQLLQQRGLM